MRRVVQVILKKSKPEDQLCLDSFYQSIKPVAVINKFLGILTLHNVWTDDIRNLKYKPFGTTLIWPILISFWNFYLTINPERRNQTIINVFLHCVRTAINLALIHWTDPNLLDLMIKIEKFDKFYSYRPAKGSRIRGYVWFLISVLIYLFFTCLLVIMVGVTVKSAYFGSFDLQPRYMALIQFIIICTELAIRFDYLRNFWILKEQDIIKYQSENEISEIRLNHGHLILIAESINNSCGIRITTFVFSMTYEVIINFYNRVNLSKEYLFGMTMYSVFDTIILITLLNVANQLKEKSKSLLPVLSQIPLNKLNAACQSEIELLMTQIYTKQAEISAKGYFKLEPPLLVSIAMTSATYFMLCIQLQDELHDALSELGSLIRNFVRVTRIQVPF